MDSRAGTPAQPDDLIDLDALVAAYYDRQPDPHNPAEQVVFGTSGHRGSAFDGAFNQNHIIAITAAIIEYRKQQGIGGPLFIGRDTHGLSLPAWQTALEVLAAAEVTVQIDARDSFTPTPAISRAILVANGCDQPARRGSLPKPANQADGIVVTPSHNPPRDGGFKYNPPHGGPAGAEITTWIADRANQMLRNGEVNQVKRVSLSQALAAPTTGRYDFMAAYVNDLASVVDMAAIKQAGVRIGADPLGGASVEYWGAIAEHYGLALTVVNPKVDPTWAFMTLDWDGKIRMDCSSASAMASLTAIMQPADGSAAPYDIATGNDADSDRHGIVTAQGLMNPNHYLAAAIAYLFGGARPLWPNQATVGKTLVSSSLIDKVATWRGRQLWEVPVGFKWFVPGLLDGSTGFGGEESAGASCLRRDATVWTTDKDGLLLALLASEILAVTGQTPAQLHAQLVEQFGQSWYARVDAPATRQQKAQLAQLSPQQVTATSLAGAPITGKLTAAPGNGAGIGGLKVTTEQAWFAARPSGTEDVYKIYAESFVSADHLAEIQHQARLVVADALAE